MEQNGVPEAITITEATSGPLDRKRPTNLTAPCGAAEFGPPRATRVRGALPPE